ncbi:polysaccharide deacetylase family protein [Congregibacter litoralis]|uniref:Putative xylanase/chitin deacetylase n=1 Tax=Congregibacter litoralis KT71 TaxID=314285 RepID=A4A4X6_9GAMM|nr:polysaccharide deacetylase family protein [Congregibacter litoralis]EAQ98847.2 putative xylanase/chitin deacetylase [Congregibacter litoralis KT71]
MARRLLVACLAALSLGGVSTGAAEHGVILLYHRISDEGPHSTRVSPNRFAAHLDLIEEQGYEVIPLQDLLDGVYSNGVLPERAVALTFDDAYRSVGDLAYPMLRERNMPFSVFVATDVVDESSPAFLNWPTLRAMARDTLATFGPHSQSHRHLESLDPKSDANTPGATRANEIDGSLARLREELGEIRADAVLKVFAYPFGEYSRATEALLSERDLFGLAQQSGPVAGTTPRTRIPRFPLYRGGDSDARLKTALATRPLPVINDTDSQVFFTPGAPLPREWRLQLADAAFDHRQLQCYASTGGALEQRWNDDVLLVSLPAMQAGRNKVNCTAPSRERGVFHWYSRLWLIADEDGQWLLN